jgi:hypothetical protein
VEVWEQINATLSILAWPVVIGLATLVVFREQVASLLNRITKGKVGGAEIVLAEAATKAVTEGANQEIRQITGTVGERRPLDISGGSPGGAGPGDAKEPTEPRFTREQVEKFMEIAAETGYKVASLGWHKEIEPEVRWTGDGIPQIALWDEEPRPSLRARALQEGLSPQAYLQRQRRLAEDDSKS